MVFVHVATSLPVPVVSWLGDLVLKTRRVEVGLVQVKAFDFRYAIAISINLAWDLDLMSQQVGRFGRISERQAVEDIRDYCSMSLRW